MTEDLRDAFHRKMVEVYERALRECNYKASRFLQLVQEQGGFAAARALLASNRHPDGLTRLWEQKRLDISMEALVLSEPWRQLFTPSELAVAERRLRELGYTGPPE